MKTEKQITEEIVWLQRVCFEMDAMNLSPEHYLVGVYNAQLQALQWALGGYVDGPSIILRRMLNEAVNNGRGWE